MKKKQLYPMIFCCVLWLFFCIQAVQAAPVEHIQLGLEHVQDGVFRKDRVTINYFKPFLWNVSDEAKYPRLAESLRTYGEELEAYVMQRETDARERVYSYRYRCEPCVLRADTRMVSISVDSSEAEQGNPRDMNIYRGTAWDTETGRKLMLSDIVVDRDAFLSLVKEHLREQYPDIDAGRLSGLVEGSIERYWTVDSNRVQISFPMGELSGYLGSIHTTIYFDEAKELFNQKYVETPDSYIPNGSLPILWVDTYGDGVRETLLGHRDFGAHIVCLDGEYFTLSDTVLHLVQRERGSGRCIEQAITNPKELWIGGTSIRDAFTDADTPDPIEVDMYSVYEIIGPDEVEIVPDAVGLYWMITDAVYRMQAPRKFIVVNDAGERLGVETLPAGTCLLPVKAYGGSGAYEFQMVDSSMVTSDDRLKAFCRYDDTKVSYRLGSPMEMEEAF